LRFFFKQITILFFGSFFFLWTSSLGAQPYPTVSLPDLAERWTENAIELEYATRNLYATNGLLAEENKKLESQTKTFEEKIQSLSKQVQDLNLQKKQLDIDRSTKSKKLFSFLKKVAKTEKQIQSFLEEEKILYAQSARESKAQDDLNAKISQLHQEIDQFEQKSFLQQRKEREALGRFQGPYLAAEKFLGMAMKDEKELGSSLDDLNLLIMDSCRRIADLSLERKRLELDLFEAEEEAFLLETRKTAVSQEAIREKSEQNGEIGNLTVQLAALRKEQEELKATLILRTSEVENPQRLITTPRIESLTATLQQLLEENKFLKSEIPRLSQAFHHLNTQKISIEKNLKKK
jgi:outer membrane murein-binding lipoprotein Lpp